MVLRALLAAVVLSGCVRSVPVQRLAVRTEIAVALLSEDGQPVPEAFVHKLFEALDRRNLEAHAVDPAQLGGQKLSSERFRALQVSANQVPLLLLVETRATFFGQVTGRFRWTVSLKFTAARSGEQSVSDSVDLPALMEHEHERGPEALDNVADFAAARLAPLIDGLLVTPPSADAGAQTR